MADERRTSGEYRLGDPLMVEVGVGSLAVTRHPEYLLTPALGSCVGVALWDSMLRQGGLAHVMLPKPLDTTDPADNIRFASVAIPELVKQLSEAGSMRRRLVAKIAGGATMFASDTMLATIGDRNVDEVKKQLGVLNIPIVAEDTGESHARTVELRLNTGVFVVRSYLYGVKEL